MQIEKSTRKTKALDSEIERRTESQPARTTEFSEENLEMSLNQQDIHYNYKTNMLGGRKTFIAFKNPTSYAIASFDCALKVLEEASVIYRNQYSLIDVIQEMVYIDHLDCYLIHSGSKLLRKDPDSNNPYLLMRENGYVRAVATHLEILKTQQKTDFL